jgi:hypothetical protein
LTDAEETESKAAEIVSHSFSGLTVLPSKVFCSAPKSLNEVPIHSETSDKKSHYDYVPTPLPPNVLSMQESQATMREGCDHSNLLQ